MQTAYAALGAQRYQVERNWAQADLGSLCSVAVLADGRLVGRRRIRGVDGCIHVAEVLPDCLTRLRPD